MIGNASATGRFSAPASPSPSPTRLKRPSPSPPAVATRSGPLTGTRAARSTTAPSAAAPPTQAAAAMPSKQATDSIGSRLFPHSSTAVSTHAAAMAVMAAARVVSHDVGWESSTRRD